MDEYVKVSIKARKDSIFNVYEVTDKGLLKKIDSLFAEIEELGASCKDATEFEAKFAASPLNQKYMDIFMELAKTQATANTAESFAKQAATGAVTDVVRGAVGNAVPTSRAAAHQKVYDAARDIPGVGGVLEVKQYADFFGRFKKKKDQSEDD